MLNIDLASDGATTEDCDSLIGTNLNLRTGKWTREEELFTNRMITDFQEGVLEDCEEGCTLRCYLASRLHCSPMRISKKLAGLRMGKSAFRRKLQSSPDYDPEASEVSSAALIQLRKDFYKVLVESDSSDGNERVRKPGNDGVESIGSKDDDSEIMTESSSSRKYRGQKRAMKSEEWGGSKDPIQRDEDLFKLPLHICESSLNIHILDKSDIASLLELEPATKRQFIANDGWDFYSDTDLIPIFGI